MALPLESCRRCGPPETGRRRRTGSVNDVTSSTSVADALHLISRQHQPLSAHALQSPSAFTAPAEPILVESDAILNRLIPSRCVSLPNSHIPISCPYNLYPPPEPSTSHSGPLFAHPEHQQPCPHISPLLPYRHNTMPSRFRTSSDQENWSHPRSSGRDIAQVRPPSHFHPVSDSVYYSPQHRVRRSAQGTPFPPPLIEPRPRRHHSVHIVSYPPGFIPRELRTGADASQPPAHLSEEEKEQWRRREASRRKREAEKRTREEKERKKEEKRRKKEEKKQAKRREKELQENQEKRLSWRSLPSGGDKVGRVISKIIAVFSAAAKSPPDARESQTIESRPLSFISFSRRPSRIEPSPEFVLTAELPPAPEPTTFMTGAAVASRPRPQSEVMTSATVPANRNSILSTRSTKSAMAAPPGPDLRQHPVARVSGLSCAILMAEPNVFLKGFDRRLRGDHEIPTSSALLRGKLQLRVSKNVKIKSITLKLVGKARTEWPEGIPPAKVETFEEDTLRSQSLVFFHAMHQGMWDTEYGMHCVYTHDPEPSGGFLQVTGSATSLLLSKNRKSTLSAKEYKRLSLQSVKSRSFGKGDSPLINEVQAKGYKVFRPGTYEYAFELPIDHTQLETAKTPYGSVRWTLETTIERAGTFKPDLHGTREVIIVRLPDELSLEMVEPISVSRDWDDQLHYDIVVAAKSFPVGGVVPVAIRLTPLAKVRVHKIKVYVTEKIECMTNDERVRRQVPVHKILLMEKAPGRPAYLRFPNSEFRILSGGEATPEQRAAAWQEVQRHRRGDEQTQRRPEPVPSPDNLLGDLDFGLESFWGTTELEMNLPLPTCFMMELNKGLKLHPHCSWKNMKVEHTIKVVLRVSRIDKDDPEGKRRRHYEIAIDNPFTLLNCRASKGNTMLPRYSGVEGVTVPDQLPQMLCGCPDSPPLDPTLTGLTRPLTLIEDFGLGRRARLDHSMPEPPLSSSAARQQGPPSALPETADGPAEPDRPIHLIRVPSHNPPAFDADEPPPPLQTPPPNYDTVIGTPSVNGLADYFTRLAAYEGSTRPPRPDNMTEQELAKPDSDPEDSNEPDTRTTGPSTQPVGEGVGTDADPFDTSLNPANTTNGNSRNQEGDAGQENAVGLGLTAPYPVYRHHSLGNINTSRLHSQSQDNSTTATTGGGGAAAAAASEEAVHSPDSDFDSDSDGGAARPHRRGRVNVPNPRTPGGRMVPSRSLEIERPAVRLDMSKVVRRRRL